MAVRTKRIGTSFRDQQAGFSGSNDPLATLPINHPEALADFFATERALRKMATDTDVYTQNDLLFKVKTLVQPTLMRPLGFTYGTDELVLEDFANQRTIATPTATGGLYRTSADSAGTFIPTGDHAEPSANPSFRRWSTAAAHVTNVAAVAMFKVDRNDADAVMGVSVRASSATDHYRAEIRVSGQTANLVNRASSTDTSDASASVATEVPNTGLYWVSIGIRYNTGNRVVVAVNGRVVHDVTASAGAQAQAGNSIGIWQSGVAPGSGPVLLKAFAV